MTAKKTVSKKTRSTILLEWVKRHFAVIVLFILMFFLVYKNVWAYYQSIYYEDFMSVMDSSHQPTQWWRFKYETKRAFLPYEPIRIKIKYGVLGKKERDVAKNSPNMSILLMGANYTINNINKDQGTLYEPDKIEEKNPDVMSNFIEHNTGSVKLRPSEDVVDLYEGEAEVFYRKPGNYPMSFSYWFTGQSFMLTPKIEIGSITDVMNKKTNDLLYVLTVINLLFLFYVEFFKKPKTTS